MRLIDASGLASSLSNLFDGYAHTCQTIQPDAEGYAWVLYDMGNKIDSTTHVRVIQNTTYAQPSNITVHLGGTGHRTDPKCIISDDFETGGLANGTVACESGKTFGGRYGLVVGAQNVTLHMCEIEFYGQSKHRALLTYHYYTTTSSVFRYMVSSLQPYL